jgi:hypothetical protein
MRQLLLTDMVGPFNLRVLHGHCPMVSPAQPALVDNHAIDRGLQPEAVPHSARQVTTICCARKTPKSFWHAES